jgi:hypothetical protein
MKPLRSGNTPGRLGELLVSEYGGGWLPLDILLLVLRLLLFGRSRLGGRRLEAVLRDLIARIVFIAPPLRAASSQSHS